MLLYYKKNSYVNTCKLKAAVSRKGESKKVDLGLERGTDRQKRVQRASYPDSGLPPCYASFTGRTLNSLSLNG